MTSYCLYNSIVINLADRQQIFDFGIELESTYQELSKNVLFVNLPSTKWKVMASFVFFIVATFQICACQVRCVYKLAKSFISQDTLVNFRKSHQI